MTWHDGTRWATVGNNQSGKYRGKFVFLPVAPAFFVKRFTEKSEISRMYLQFKNPACWILYWGKARHCCVYNNHGAKSNFSHQNGQKHFPSGNQALQKGKLLFDIHSFIHACMRSCYLGNFLAVNFHPTLKKLFFLLNKTFFFFFPNFSASISTFCRKFLFSLCIYILRCWCWCWSTWG